MLKLDRLSQSARRLTPLFALLASTALAAPGSWSSNGPYGGLIYHLVNYEAGSGTLWTSAAGALFRTTSNGASWERLANGLPPSTAMYALAASTSAPVLYASGGSKLYRSGNGGDLWVTLGLPAEAGYILDIAVQRPGANSVAVLTGNSVWVTGNGGSTWSGSMLPNLDYFRTIEFASDGTIYVGMYPDPGVFGGAALIKSTTLASSWTPVTIPQAPDGLIQIVTSPVDPQRLFLASYSGLLTSADAGLAWNDVSVPANCGLVGALAPHPSLAAGLFINCEGLGLSATDDVDAPVWTTWGVAEGLTVNGIDPVQAVTIQVAPNWPTTPSVYIGTADGGLLRTTNGGASWSAINQGIEATHIRALASHPLDTGSSATVLAGYGGGYTSTHPVYKSPDNGATWNPSHSGMNAEQIHGLMIDPTTVDNDPFTAENFTAYAAGASFATPRNLGYARINGLYKSVDGGSSWSNIDNGIAIVDGVPSMGTVRAIVADPRSCAAPPPTGPCLPGSGGLQTLFAIGSGRVDTHSPGTPTASERIYKSTNAGASWSPSANGLPPMWEDIMPGDDVMRIYSQGVALVIDPSNTQIVYASTGIKGNIFRPGADEATLANGVFKSIDGGANWVHSSVGLPHYFGPTSSQHHVLSLAINPANTQVLYAGLPGYVPGDDVASLYKSTDAGATWFESSTGIAGAGVNALLIDPNDASGDTIYAGTSGTATNPGGVFRSTDAGASWNSYSIGLPALSTTSLAIPARNAGDPVRLLAGTNAGVWEFTEVPDEDADGSPTAVEDGVVAGDGNDDGVADAEQTNVASVETPVAANVALRAGIAGSSTIEIVDGSGCDQLNDSYGQSANLFPQDPLGAASHDARGMIHFALPTCSATKVRVTFHDASFDASWTWRNYGPRIPGDESSFGWYSFAGAQRIDIDTWELDLDALRQGNYRNDPNDILFIGGPGKLPDVIFGNGFQ